MTNVVKLWFDLSGVGSFTDFTRINDECRMLGDGRDSVTITYGRRMISGRVPPTMVELDYLDNEALLNDENGESPYYRQLVEFTPMIITLNGDVIAYVELAAIRVKEITSGNVKLTIEGAGIKRRLGHGVWSRPLRSPAYRALSADANTDTRVFYAPLEEASGATRFEIFNNIGSITYTGTINFGSYTAAPSAERMLTFGTDGQLSITIPDYTSTMHKFCSLWTLPDPSLPATTTLLRLYCQGGNVSYIDLDYAASGDGSLILRAYNNVGGLIDDANSVGWGANIIAKHLFMSLELTQNGADLDTRVLLVTDVYSNFNDDPLTGVTIGRIVTIIVAQTDCSGASFGHPILGNDTTAFPNYISPIGGFGTIEVVGIRGFTGEPADDRVRRICSEEGISTATLSSSQFGGGDGTLLGPQPIKPFLDIIETSMEIDGGLLLENIASEALVIVTRRFMCNQAPVITADYSDLVPPLLPTKDDQGKQNDVTVKNTNGSTSRYIIPDGDYPHYSTEPAPNGMNNVPGSVELNLYDDDDGPLQAAWRAHLGAWRGQRIPAMTYQLARPNVASDAALLDGFYAAQPGNTILQGTTGGNATKWVPPGDMLVMIQGYQRKVSQIGDTYSVNVTPGEPWEVKVTDANAAILANSIDAAATSLWIDPGLLGPSWTLNDVFYIQIDGDVMKVTASFDETPTFASAGAIANGNNAPVTPGMPAGIDPGEGVSLFIWATIRNSGTGTPDDETGWTTLASFGNTKLYHRYYQTGDTAPQITFTGGAANADTQARMFAFPGLSKSFASGTKSVPAASTQLNSSAQNVAYPAFSLARDGVAMIFAWKQDDATGYAPPSGYTEMADNSTTTGDDSSIAAYYQLTGTALAAGSITVTGGAAAISRAISMAFRPTQLFFVERNIQGNATSHTAGAEVHVWRQGVTGL